ncbi:ATP-binding protein [Bradyrhizobium sp. ISRA442]|uniref:HD domain-containing protein n=1 Tax=Bradyrhizobium sp. ISRA442 TaxID=2866197 RepID=UPI00311ACC52
MTNDFRECAIWSRVFKNVDPKDIEKASRLQASFIIFRERVKGILEKISSSLPNLTVHDITHIDALWDTAGLIVGPSYPLNPMEVYVLGGAILLHDAALCFDAYEGGLEGIRNTVHWRDGLEAERDRNSERDELLSQLQLESAADFSAVRLLHADQAKTLVDRAWTDPDTGSPLFLIDDSDLRKRYGAIIGEIAASHNWSIERVEDTLPAQINAPGDWPADWRIDPVKLACILRCSDAAHIDNRRAPDFLHALSRRQGISFQHWKAQNWLSQADLDLSDSSGETIVFTSNRDFEAADAEAWWVAYDAIRLADKEIHASNELLKARPQSQNSPPFAVKRVAGVTSPESMATFLRARGWKPWHAELHVGNIERLVKTLGGENLYGAGDKAEHFAIVLRELLQNARDAIVARRNIEPEYAGKIRVRVNDVPATVEVVDDGVGMSQRVLTGPLLDFGSSFWKSDMVNDEFPGLRSSGFASVGRYGIGFFSVFMVANHVRVASRRWDRGLDTVASITFSKGLTLRPTFSTADKLPVGGSASTAVTCGLKSLGDNPPSEWVYKLNHDQELRVPFDAFVARITAAVDVPIEVSVNGSAWTVAHNPIEEVIAGSYETKLEWLKKITLFAHLPSDLAALEDAARRLQPIYSNGTLVGFAALRLELGEAAPNGGMGTVGGFFPAGYRGVGGVKSYYGYMAQLPNSAKRDAGKRLASNTDLTVWAEGQLKLLAARIGPTECLSLSYHLSEFNVDPSPYVTVVLFKGTAPLIVSLDQAFELLKSEPIAFFKFNMMDHVDSYVQELSFDNYLTFKPLMHGVFLSLIVEDGVPKNPNSFIGCLHRRAARDGCRLIFETKHTTVPTIGGPAHIFIVSLAPL